MQKTSPRRSPGPGDYPSAKAIVYTGGVPATLRLLLAAWIVSAVALSGCGQRRFANENDILRARVLELETAVTALEDRITELEAELAARVVAPASPSPEIAANTPHVARITIGRLSHLRDIDEDGTPDTLIAYVTPTDGRGRFVQLVGHLTVHAALLPARTDSDTIGRRVLSPSEVRAAYRSSMMGTHYTIEVPISLPGDADQFTECDVRATYDDGRTNQRFETSRAIALR